MLKQNNRWLAVLCLVAFAPGPASALNPTPRDWDQWQPQIDTSDARLEQTVSVQEPMVEVDDLLAILSRATGVGLQASDDLRDLPVVVFAENRRLDGLLVGLAEVADGYWFFPRGDDDPAARRYCLGRGSKLLTPDQRVERVLARREESYHLPFVDVRADRLKEYAAALALSPEEVLAQYEASDPWLCATMLDAGLRPMIRKVCELDDAQRDQLNRTGEIAFRLSEADEEFREHLRRWAAGEYGSTGSMTWAADPDRLPRFDTPEERWENAAVKFWWHPSGVQTVLYVPDQGWFDEDVVRLKNDTPLSARFHLIDLGYREETPEYRKFAVEEGRRWQQEHPGFPGEAERARMFSGSPNIADPRLDLVVDLRSLEDRSVSTLLQHVAAKHGISIMSPYLPPDLCRVDPPSGESSEVTLRDLLQELRRYRGGCLTWDFRGIYLILRDTEVDLIGAGRLPESLARRWEELNVPGKHVALGDLTSLLAATNMAQIDALQKKPSAFHRVHLAGPLRAYGLLDAGQRARLERSDGLPCSQLRQDQMPALLRAARGDYPWVTAADLDNAVLRTVPRTLASGEAGVSFVLEFELPGGGTDRLALFTSPLQVRMQ